MTYDRRPPNDTRVMRPLTFFSTLIISAALALLIACSEDGGAPPTGQSRARQLYERNCAACHGPQGEGRQLGTLRVPSLREGRAVTDPDSRVLTQIRDGGNGMPPFKYSLTDEEIDILFHYLRQDLQGSTAPRP